MKWGWMVLMALTGSAVADSDPFQETAPKASSQVEEGEPSWWDQFWSENFGYRWEVMSQFGMTREGVASSRQSGGVEVLKRFSTSTKTFAGVNVQGRWVRRDGFTNAPNDMEGMNRPGWFLEYHNAYIDWFNVLDPFLNEDQQSAVIGKFNVRIGRFYLPFGLNLQTDTHGTVLQLSNERNFGFERDWYAGGWGILTDEIRYDVYYLMGSGYAMRWNDQRGLVAARISLANKFLSESGLEGGFSFLTGQRFAPEAVMRSPAIAAAAGGTDRVETTRYGLDGRYRMLVASGVVTWTAEVSGGQDAPNPVWTQLYQIEYLDASRRWGAASQWRWFWQDPSKDAAMMPGIPLGSADASWLGEVTWYAANDVSSSRLEWVKLACEVALARRQEPLTATWTLQYYRYW